MRRSIALASLYLLSLGAALAQRFLETSTYKASETNANTCLEGTSPITDLEACRSALDALGFSWGGTDSWDNFPRFCFFAPRDEKGYFNTHRIGDRHSQSSPICDTYMDVTTQDSLGVRYSCGTPTCHLYASVIGASLFACCPGSTIILCWIRFKRCRTPTGARPSEAEWQAQPVTMVPAGESSDVALPVMFGSLVGLKSLKPSRSVEELPTVVVEETALHEMEFQSSIFLKVPSKSSDGHQVMFNHAAAEDVTSLEISKQAPPEQSQAKAHAQSQLVQVVEPVDVASESNFVAGGVLPSGRLFVADGHAVGRFTGLQPSSNHALQILQQSSEQPRQPPKMEVIAAPDSARHCGFFTGCL